MLGWFKKKFKKQDADTVPKDATINEISTDTSLATMSSLNEKQQRSIKFHFPIHRAGRRKRYDASAGYS